MDDAQKISANIPRQLLAEATRATGLGITETIVKGLQLVKRTSALQKAKRLQGQLKIDLDLDVSRERARR